MTNFNHVTAEQLGQDATEQDVIEFQALCREVKRLHPEMDDEAVTEAVWGDGDYYANAKKLGVHDVSRFFLMSNPNN